MRPSEERRLVCTRVRAGDGGLCPKAGQLGWTTGEQRGGHISDMEAPLTRFSRSGACFSWCAKRDSNPRPWD